MFRLSAISFVLLLACGCTTRYTADIREFETRGIIVTTANEIFRDGKPAEFTPAHLIRVEKWGLRILGIIPVGNASLRDVVRLFAEEAKILDVDAVVSVKFSAYKASFPWCLLNWYVSSEISGMGVKFGEKDKTEKKK